jgi:cation diffusion facilitator CzcD-associated flavoprotein CzcO
MFEIDVEHAERSRAYVNKEVKHPVTAERLKAWYPGWCKRPTFHDGFLSAFNQANVTLVDTNGKGIERYTESGVLANEVEYDLDLLVLATGFSPSSRTSPAERMDGAIIGRDGRSIQDKWKSSDFGTMFGLMTNQFPNMFFYGVSGIGSSPNLTSYYDAIAKLAAHIVAAATYQADGSKKLIVEVTKNAEDEYTDEVEKRSLWYTLLKDCTPGYFNGEGAVAQEQTPEQAKLAARTSGWGSGAVDYHAITQAYMSKAKLEGIELRA